MMENITEESIREIISDTTYFIPNANIMVLIQRISINMQRYEQPDGIKIINEILGGNTAAQSIHDGVYLFITPLKYREQFLNDVELIEKAIHDPINFDDSRCKVLNPGHTHPGRLVTDSMPSYMKLKEWMYSSIFECDNNLFMMIYYISGRLYMYTQSEYNITNSDIFVQYNSDDNKKLKEFLKSHIEGSESYEFDPNLGKTKDEDIDYLKAILANEDIWYKNFIK